MLRDSRGQVLRFVECFFEYRTDTMVWGHDGLGVRKTAVEGYPWTRVWGQPPATARTFCARHGFGGSPASVEGTPDTGLGAAYPQPCPQTIVSVRYIESSATGYFLITRIFRHCSPGGPDLIKATG
jgi:hypothetical protein